MNKINKLLAIAFAFLLSSTIAHSAQYFGFGLGNASWDLKPLGGAFELEDTSAFRVFMGSRKGNTGFEGEMNFSFHDWENSGGAATHNAFNIIVSGIGFKDISESIDLYGKIGLNLWSTTVDLLGTNYEGDSGIGLALGVGANFAVSEKVHLRTEYQVFPGLEDGIDSGDVSQFTLNAVFNY